MTKYKSGSFLKRRRKKSSNGKGSLPWGLGLGQWLAILTLVVAAGSVVELKDLTYLRDIVKTNLEAAVRNAISSASYTVDFAWQTVKAIPGMMVATLSYLWGCLFVALEWSTCTAVWVVGTVATFVVKYVAASLWYLGIPTWLGVAISTSILMLWTVIHCFRLDAVVWALALTVSSMGAVLYGLVCVGGFLWNFDTEVVAAAALSVWQHGGFWYEALVLVGGAILLLLDRQVHPVVMCAGAPIVGLTLMAVKVLFQGSPIAWMVVWMLCWYLSLVIASPRTDFRYGMTGLAWGAVIFVMNAGATGPEFAFENVSSLIQLAMWAVAIAATFGAVELAKRDAARRARQRLRFQAYRHRNLTPFPDFNRIHYDRNYLRRQIELREQAKKRHKEEREYRKRQREEQEDRKRELRLERLTKLHGKPPPAELLCPITLQLFEDPVRSPQGFVFERQAIVCWLNTTAPSSTCPLTRLPLAKKDLKAARDIRYKVHQWAGIEHTASAKRMETKRKPDSKSANCKTTTTTTPAAVNNDYNRKRAQANATVASWSTGQIAFTRADAEAAVTTTTTRDYEVVTTPPRAQAQQPDAPKAKYIKTHSLSDVVEEKQKQQTRSWWRCCCSNAKVNAKVKGRTDSRASDERARKRLQLIEAIKTGRDLSAILSAIDL